MIARKPIKPRSTKQPERDFSSGMSAKFIPQMPARILNGTKIALTIVRILMMLLSRREASQM
jgi:hypothetical protein